MKIVVIGASGATGQDLLRVLLDDNQTENVVALVRKPMDISHEKLTTSIINFDDTQSWKNLVIGDVAISCLGTTKKDAGSQAKQKIIDLDYPLAFATAAKTNNIPHFILLSSMGANSSSVFFYSRIKGMLENEIIKMKFQQTIILRPGLLKRKNTNRFGEKLMVKSLEAMNQIGLFVKYKPLPTSVLASIMGKFVLMKNNGLSIIESPEIWKIGSAPAIRS
jgi:dTDP-4-dehydrorhamnose reductase